MAVMKLEKTNVEDMLPLTPIQQGMLFHYLSEPWSGHYIEQLSLRLEGDISVPRLKEAWETVCANNEMLRTVFRWEGLDNPVQIILKSKELQMTVHDCTMHSGEQQEQAVREVKEADLAQKFDLRHEVIRINVCLTGRESCELVISNHHIICDGWSTGILLREFLDCYNRLTAGLAPERPANKSSFRQYVQWLGRQDKEAGLRYWRMETADQDSLSLLPQDPGMKSAAGENEDSYAAAYVFDCAGDLAEPVEQWAARHEVTAAAVFYTVWGLLLSRYNRQHEVLFGTTVSGRSGEIPGMEQSVGLYINTLPLRVSCEAGDTLLDVVKRVHNRLIERQEYEYVALQDMMADRAEQGGELFQSLVVMENYPLDRVLNAAERAVRIASYQMHERTHYDFTVQITAFGGEAPEVQFTYNEALFSSRTAVRIAGHFRHVLRQLTAGPQLAASLLELVPAEEKLKLLHEFSFGGRMDWTEEESKSAAPCLHAGLELQAARLEERTALVYGGGSLTYGEVNRRANQLARKLQGMGITRGTAAAVRMHRSPEMIIGLLAILKAGAAYLPVLPGFPAERAAYMLEDSGASLVLTHMAAAAADNSTCALEGIRTLNLDDPALYEGDASDLDTPVSGEDLAYIIYTSGSTGLPKGVAVEHRSAFNTLQAMQRICPLGEEDTYLLKTTFTFDVSVCELFGWFQGGGRLAILEPEGEKEPARWMAAIRDFRVTHVNFVPSLLAFMMQELPDQQLEELNSLRYVLAAGEALKPSLAEAVHTRLPHVRMFNLYGPTEAAIYATWHEVKQDGLRSSSVPIGRPLDNMHIYILDHEGGLCPEGVLGELCIAGVGVARGYLNRDDLTAERFMIDPVGQAGRMYRTGDLARWLPDGTIEYGGRTDYQVKVRGYRIEPGEIEACLAAHPAVKEAVVIHRTNSQGEAYLCAFFTAEQQLDTAELRAYASRELPAYMIPAYLEQLPELPLTPSGKIDRKALPETALQPGNASGYEAPVTDVQGILVQVWEEVLGTKGIGISHSFIELGGDSIKAMKVASRLMKYGYQAEIKHILLHPTIRDLSAHVTGIRQQASQKAEEGIVRLTPIQELFFRRVQTDRHHFNQSFMLCAEERLDISCLRRALDELVRHHDALRMIFRIHDGRVEQVNRPVDSGGCDFAVISLIGDREAEARMTGLADECQAGMNLEKGPLMKARLFQTDAGDHLLLVIHHLVVDGVSWRIIMEDLAAVYMQLVKGEAANLGQRTASFRQWSDSLHAYASSERLAGEADYWRTVEGTPVQPLPFVQRTAGEASNRMGDTRMLTTTLTAELTSNLLQDVHAAYHTQVEDYLLAALGSAFKRVTGLERLLLHLEGHGRQEIIQEQPVLRTVGWFTSMYPVILELAGLDYDRYDVTLPDHIRQVKETLRQIPHKGIGYGVLKYLSPPELREKVSYRLQPEVSFNYLGQFDDDLRQGPFTLSPVSPGRETSPKLERQSVLEIYGMVKGGCLELNWVYNKHQVSEEVMQELSSHYLQELQMMIEHGQAVKQALRTPSDFPYAALSMTELDALTDRFRSRQQEMANLYKLSPLQEGLLFHDRLDPDSSAYVQQIALRVAGVADVQRLDRALQELFARYEALRTQIIYEQISRPHQAVLEQLISPVRVADLRSLTEELEQEQAIADYMKADRMQGFQLDGEPLLRVTVFLLRDDSWHLLWTYHHIIMDGWCAASLFKQLFTLYRDGEKAVLEQAAPYGRYMEWLEGRDKEQAHRFWSGYLAGYEERAGFPRRTAGPASYEPGELQLLLSAELTRRLEETARRHHTTLYIVFQAVWAIMLQRYSGSRDVMFGSVVSGRSPEVEGIEHMAGLFINTIPVRVRTEEGERFCDLLDRLRRMNAEASAYEYCPLAEIQSLADVKQELINHLLIFENYPLDMEAIQGTGAAEQLVIQDIQVVEQTSYDLDVTVIPDEHLLVKFSFNRKVYDQQLVEQLAAHLQYIAEQVTESPEIAVHAIELMTEEEKKRLAAAFNATDAALPQKTVHELFEAQAARLPEAAAVLFGKERICYAELNSRANRLARYLLAQGAGREELVAIVMDRSPDMLTAILAIWKAGGAYVPVDPGYPAARQQKIIRESGVRFLIGVSESVGGLGAEILSMRLILLDLEEAEISREPEANIGLQIKPNQLAYVIYTSGSTGTPKGTMIEHAGMLNHILAEIEELEITEGTVLAQNASHCFDISVWQFVAALTVGGVTAIYPNELVLEPAQFIERIIKDKTAILEVVPSYLSVMMDFMEDTGVRLPDLKYLMITGETVKPAMVRRWFGLCPDIRMVNAYGPAEAADDISQYVMDKPPESEPVPIGRPIRNMRIYIVDDQLRLCPIGTIGEICVSGIGVGRGYLRDPERTAAVFLEDPFREEEGVRMYRTGDLGRWLPDGNIEFYGRKDYQVKIRGFRIELGEIEARLAEHGGVKEAVVLDVEDAQGVKQLAAYVTAAGGAVPETAELKAYLARHLPEYMVPASVQVLAELPLSPNGKIDRKALPKPELATGGMAGGPPRTETERKLAAIWQEVLGVVEAGREQSFFEAGGHSLKAMTLVSRIHKELGAELPLREVFARPLLHMQAAYIDQAAGQGEAYIRIPQAPEQPSYPASPVQKRLFALSQMDGAGMSYNITMTYTLTGALDAERLQKAWRQVVERHEALRTSFAYVDGELMQQIVPQADADIEPLPGIAAEAGEDEGSAVRRRAAAFFKPFDLKNGPLIRAGLLPLAADRSLFLIDIHHTIADGMSVPLLMQELCALYEGQALQPVPLHYKDYTCWQLQEPYQQDQQDHEAYWLNELSGELPVLDLVTDHPRPSARSFEGGHVRFGINKELTAGLRSIADASGTTLYTVMLAAFSVLLSKYTAQEDILIGSPVAGRTHADLEQVVGMFVNTVVVRSQPRQDLTFDGLLGQLKDRVIQAFEHQDYPFEQLVDKLGLQRDASRNPLFDVLFILQNVDRSSLLMDQVSIEPYDYLHRTAKFDLTLFAAEEQDGISAGFEYSVQLFRQETVERMAVHYLQLLGSLAECGGQIQLSELSLLSHEERARITAEFAVNPCEITGPATIHQRFEEQVMKRPQHPAVLYNNDTITYAELNARANLLARSIRASRPGVRAGHERRRDQEDGLLVGIMAKHPVDRIAAVLAVLKAGLAYVPIDPSYPRERIAHMAEDSGMQLVLTDLAEAPQLLPEGVKMLSLGQEPGVSAEENNQAADQDNPCLDIQPSDLAYIIYTSGSTGLPKGVAITHQGVINYAAWRTKAYGIGADDRSLQLISFSFDGYGASLYSALLTGGSLVVVGDEESKDYKVISQLASRHGVTSFSAIPSMYQALLDFAEAGGGLGQLKTVVLAAERPAEELVARSLRMLPKTLLINEYGPTENTIATTAQIGIEPGRTAVIGRPVGNHEIYIIDRSGQPVPVGVPGELCVAGPGLARGYWKKPDLTAEKFTSHPETGRRMYRTGDMARWLEDGTIEFLGRLDEQVKIRGFRIELEEIASRLRLHPDVAEAVVSDRRDEHGQPYLCAYIIPGAETAGEDDGHSADHAQNSTARADSNSGALTASSGSPSPSYTVTARQAAGYRTFLAEALPDYMIPGYFVHLERLPLSPNGKLDKKALPAPDRSSGASEAYEVPRTEMESRLAEIWQQVLGTERVGIHDHFFNLGGDSIKAIQVSSRLHQQGLVLEMKHLFQHPVLMQLAPYIKEDEETISQDEVTGNVPLTAIQHWFFSQGFEEQHHFNQAVMLHRSSGFDADALKQALTAIIVHHDALRMVFRQVDGHWTAQNLSADETGPVALHIVETGSMPEGERQAHISRQVEAAQRSLDIEQGPLYRFTLLRTTDGDHLHIVIHHLVVDGVSWRILLEDLAEAYDKAERGEAVQLPAKTLSVREWAHKVRQYAGHSELLKEIPYWQAVEQNNPGPLPAGRTAGQRRPDEQAEAVMECTEEQTEQLLKQVHRTYNTEINDVLLTALALALRQWSGRQKALIHLEGHGRERLDKAYNISRTIGWFTAQYPVVLDASHPGDMGYMLKSVKDSLRRIPNHGIGYGVLEYITLQEQRQGLQFGLRPEISFNYLGQSDQAQEAGAFTLSKLGSGTNISPNARKLYAMEWTGMVADGRLRMTVSYSRSEYEDAAIAELTGLYKEQLQAIISHCMGRTGTEVSPSDLVYNKLSIDKLSQISQLLNKKLK